MEASARALHWSRTIEPRGRDLFRGDTQSDPNRRIATCGARRIEPKTERMYEAGRRIRGVPVTIVGLARPALDARGVVRHLRRFWGIVVLCALLATAAAVEALALVTPHYTSALAILVDPAALNIVENDIVARQPQNDSGISQMETQVRVIRSDSVLRRVVRRLDLGNDPDFAGPGWVDRVQDWLARHIDSELGRNADPAEAALDALRKVVSVRRPERTLIIDVYVETRNAETSARIANAVADAFLDEESASRTGLAKRVSGFLGDGLASLRGGVEDVEARILRYRRDNGLVSAGGTPLSDSRLGALNQQLVTAEIRRAEARARLDQARRGAPGDAGAALPEMLQSRELRNLRQQDATLSRNTAELAARLGARHPVLLEQAAQEKDLKRQIQREKERIVDGLQQDDDRAAASEAAIRAELRDAKSEVGDNDRAEVGLRELNRELAARRSVYASYLRRTQEVGAQERIDSARIRVLSPGTPSSVPSWPPARKPILIQSFALGLVLGVVIALILGARADRRRFEASADLAPAFGDAGHLQPDAS